MILDLSPLADMIAERLRSNAAPDEVLDTKGAAALLLVSEDTALRWAKAGTIPARKLDGIWRYRRSALLDHITANAHRGAESVATAAD